MNYNIPFAPPVTAERDELDATPIALLTGLRLKDDAGREETRTWGAVRVFLNQPAKEYDEGALTSKGNDKFDKPEDLTLYSHGRFKGGYRTKANFLGAGTVGVDFDEDHGLTAQTAHAKLESGGIEAVIRTTFNDRNGTRFNVTALLSCPTATPEEHVRVWDHVNATLGGKADKTTRDAARKFFLPAIVKGRQYLCLHSKGRPVDVAAILDATPADAPLPEGTGAASAHADLDPKYNAAVAIVAAGLRAQCPTTGAGGGRHYACGALAGALARGDVVRHLPPPGQVAAFVGAAAREAAFSKIEMKEGYARSTVDKLASGCAVTGWPELERTYPMVYAAVRTAFPLPSLTGHFAPASPAANDGDEDEKSGVFEVPTTHTYTFDLKECVAGGNDQTNALSQKGLTAQLISGKDWENVWRYDVFAKRRLAVRPPLRLDAEEGVVTEADLANIQVYFAWHGSKVSLDMIRTAIASAVSCNSFHPVQDYLRACAETAPTTDHLRSIAGRLFGSDEKDSAQASEYVRKWMIGCVARILRPGCQFDLALALVGLEGGEGKSEFFRTLAGDEWYRSNMPDIANPQKVGMAVAGHWIIELGELASMTKAQREIFLEFMTRKSEKYDNKYERDETHAPRQFGLCATTNREECLDALDLAVQRRFLPIKVKQKIDIAWVRAHRDELWAEAYRAYMAGETWHYDNERALDAAKADFTHSSPLAEALNSYLAANANRKTVDGMSATQIYGYVMALGQANRPTPSSSQLQELSRLLATQPGVTRKRRNSSRLYEIRPLGKDGEPQSVEAYETDKAAEEEVKKVRSEHTTPFSYKPN